MQDNKRKHKRVEGFFEVFVNLSPEAPDRFYCSAQDISEGGMRIRTPRQLKQGNHAILTFSVSNYPTDITAQIVVAWASGTPKKDGFFESGIKFLVINNIELEAIRSYISQHTDRIV